MHDELPGAARSMRAAAGRRSVAAELLLIALGGMVGASVRYGIARWMPVEQGRFPWATFWTNVSGSFMLGVVVVLAGVGAGRTASAGGRRSRYLRLFLATGLLGAFTTMSTYAVETALLLKDGQVAMAAAYGLGSLLGGLTLAYAGLFVARRITRRRARRR